MGNEKRDYHKFAWEDLGDLEQGRPNLGANVPVRFTHSICPECLSMLYPELRGR